LAAGLNVAAGQVTCEPVAQQLGHPYTPVAKVLG
jgi:alanine dehydrogenase